MRLAIDQLVFGYRDGHELLASSIDIDPRVEATLLPHTDARFEDESAHYLVGIPIRGWRRYLLARIWPAAEISRPGAVWSHGLLFEPAVLGSVDPVGLLSLFRRPGDDLGDYRRAIELDAPGYVVVEPPDPLIASVCWAMYSELHKGAVVIWPDVVEAEKTLLAAWRTQPSSARSTFSFRTRGRARTGESPYQIQVASTLGGRSGSDVISVLDARRIDLGQIPSWVELIAASAAQPESEFGLFLGAFSRSRQSVPDLARLWPLIQARSPSGIDVLRFLEDRFPKPGTMRRLKAELFGMPRDNGGLWQLPEVERVSALLEVGTDALRRDDLDLAARLGSLWGGTERGAMLRLLDRHESLASQEADVLVSTAALGLGPAEIAARSQNRGLLERVADARPAVLAEPEFWAALRASDLRRVIAVAQSRIDGRALVAGLVAAGDDQRVNDALACGVDPLLVADALARENPEDLSRWSTVFARHERDLGSRLASTARVRAETMLLIVAALAMSDTELVALRRWLPPARVAHDRRDPAAERAAARIMARALTATSESARKLIIECFGPVHAALDERRLDSDSWAALDAVLPASKENPSKRVRRALVESMERKDWTEADLARALAPAGPEATRVIKLVGKKHPLRRLVEGAVDVVAGPLRG